MHAAEALSAFYPDSKNIAKTGGCCSNYSIASGIGVLLVSSI